MFRVILRFMNHHHAHQLLRASDPRMAALIARSRRYEIGPAVSIRPFDALAESIAYQQLNGKAAASDLEPRPRALSKKKTARSRKSSRHTGRNASRCWSFAREDRSDKGPCCENIGWNGPIQSRTSSDER